MSVLISPIPALQDNYIWVIVHTEEHSALIVDPGESKPVIEFLAHHQLTLKGILITHHHWDHVNGVADLLNYFSVPVYGSRLSQLPIVTHHLADGQSDFAPTPFPNYRVFTIPGHTLDHIAYYADGHLFCGDTLFAGGCGRLFEGTAEQLYHSLQKIARLPDETQLYCAHEYTVQNLRFAQHVEPNNAAIAQRLHHVQNLRAQNQPSIPSILYEEKQTNPFLRCNSFEIRRHTEAYAQCILPNPNSVFSALRVWKNNF